MIDFSYLLFFSKRIIKAGLFLKYYCRYKNASKKVAIWMGCIYEIGRYSDLSHVASKKVAIWMGYVYEIGRYSDLSHVASKKVAKMYGVSYMLEY